MKKFSPCTDLAIEAAEQLSATDKGRQSGVEVIREDCDLPDTVVTWVKITNTDGEKAMGKPKGNYVTVESPYMKLNDPDAHKRISELLRKYLLKMHKLDDNASVLVVGLGNRRVTPDALGPRTAGKIIVTRHMQTAAPDILPDEVRSVASISPGVMGVTGIETLETVRGITDRIRPDLVIAIDALAARRAGRINATIQMADTGVDPGAGVGNTRSGLNEKTLGVPVIAIGVPTVVDAATLVNDTLDILISAGEYDDLFGKRFKNMSDDAKYSLIQRMLEPYAENMFVTPKEVDEVINGLAEMIGRALNSALNPLLGDFLE